MNSEIFLLGIWEHLPGTLTRNFEYIPGGMLQPMDPLAIVSPLMEQTHQLVVRYNYKLEVQSVKQLRSIGLLSTFSYLCKDGKLSCRLL